MVAPLQVRPEEDRSDNAISLHYAPHRHELVEPGVPMRADFARCGYVAQAIRNPLCGPRRSCGSVFLRSLPSDRTAIRD